VNGAGDRQRSTAVRVATCLTVLPGLVGGAPEEHFPRRRPSSAHNAAIMAAGTTLSRLSGFGRVLAVGWVLGQGRLADAYNQANTVPNTIYELLLGGVLSATLLPVLMEALGRKGHDRDEGAIPAVVSFLAGVLVAGTAVFWLCAPVIVDLFLLRAKGGDVAGERALATTWLRLFTPQLLFIGLTTITTALLNARRRFGAVAFSPVLANLVTIAALVVADHMVEHASISAYRADTAALAVVGIGTTAGYLVQLLAQLPALFRAGIPLWLSWHPSHPALRRIGRLSGWTIGAVISNQLSFTLVSILANSKKGQLSAFIYSYTFMQLPYAVVAVSISYAVAPDLAQLWTQINSEGFANRVGYAVRLTLALLLPGGVGYALLAHPIVVLALAHGNFTTADAGLTSTMLTIFALGLPGFSAYLLLMRAFQSKQDTRSMFWLYVAENALTIVAALVLYPLVGAPGLVVAWIGSYSVSVPFAWRRLRQAVPIVVPTGWIVRVSAATLVMAGVVAVLLGLVPAPGTLALSAGRVVIIAAVGAATFIVSARGLGVSEFNGLIARYRSLVR
jgi:putative peptidoglycan lipid II flippase